MADETKTETTTPLPDPAPVTANVPPSRAVAAKPSVEATLTDSPAPVAPAAPVRKKGAFELEEERRAQALSHSVAYRQNATANSGAVVPESDEPQATVIVHA